MGNAGPGAEQLAFVEPGRAGEQPFFFLASCPDACLEGAVDVATRFGGFHCEPSDPTSSKSGAVATAVLLGTHAADARSLGAWRGRVEAQFATLRRMSPAGRKVVGVAIAGSGVCNDQREFLQQLHKKKGFERFELKVCGDVADMERWLRSEGYVIDRLGELENVNCTTASMTSALSFAFDKRGVFTNQDSYAPGPTATAGRFGFGTEQGQTGLWGSFFTSAAQNDEAARRERVLGDVLAVVEELSDLTQASEAVVLREGEERLEESLVVAREAGLSTDDLFDCEARQIELKDWAEVAEARARRSWCCCCSGAAKKKSKSAKSKSAEGASLLRSRAAAAAAAAADNPEVNASSSPAAAIQRRIDALEYEVRAQQERLDEERSKLRLPDGTKCLYLSATLSGWVPAVVVGFEPSGPSYHLDIRQNAALENIAPLPEVSALDAWPPGTTVTYTSDSQGGRALPAVVKAFNPGARGSAGTYDLDVKLRADCANIRPRLL